MVIVLSMIMLAALSTIGLGGVMSGTTNIEIGHNAREQVQGFYTAEAGVQRAMTHLQTISLDTALSSNSGNLFNGPQDIAGGTYEVIVTDNDDGDSDTAVDADGIIEATATGMYHGAESTVKVVIQSGVTLNMDGAVGLYGPPGADFSIEMDDNTIIDGNDWALPADHNCTFGAACDGTCLTCAGTAPMPGIYAPEAPNITKVRAGATIDGEDTASFGTLSIDDTGAGQTATDVETLMGELEVSADATIIGQTTISADQTFGTRDNPQITVIEGGPTQTRFSGDIRGAGVLIVKGETDFDGDIHFEGLIVLYGPAGG